MRKHLYPLLVSAFVLLILSGCNTNSYLNCPGFASKKAVHKGGSRTPYATAQRHQKKDKRDKSKSDLAVANTNKQSNEPMGDFAIGGGGKNKNIEITLPKGMASTLQDADILAVNDYFNTQSNNKVSIEKRDGKVYVKAKSRKELSKLIFKQLKQKPAKPASAAYVDGSQSAMALASGILGILAFLFAFGPYIGLLALAMAVAAIILGILGLGSKLRGWAIAGIILGAITLIVAVLFLLFVFAFF